jgi:hypothetical protein
VRITSLVGLVGDERAEVLFKLSQVSRDVALVERGVLIVLHIFCNASTEAGLAEVLGHLLDHILNLKVLTLYFLAFLLASLDFVAEVLSLTFHVSNLVG